MPFLHELDFFPTPSLSNRLCIFDGWPKPDFYRRSVIYCTHSHIAHFCKQESTRASIRFDQSRSFPF